MRVLLSAHSRPASCGYLASVVGQLPPPPPLSRGAIGQGVRAGASSPPLSLSGAHTGQRRSMIIDGALWGCAGLRELSRHDELLCPVFRTTWNGPLARTWLNVFEPAVYVSFKMKTLEPRMSLRVHPLAARHGVERGSLSRLGGWVWGSCATCTGLTRC